MADICHLCKSETMVGLLDFGPQPICNRFLADPLDEEYTHPLAVGQCQACGLVQLSDAAPATEVKPRYDWITYAEPEGHLDRLAEIMAGLPGLTRDSTIAGVSFKDDSTLRRMNEKGFGNTWRIDVEADLGISDPCAGIETVQDRLDEEAARSMVNRSGHSDVVIARHILEHTHDMAGFMAALKGLLRKDGYVVIEAPDCMFSLQAPDYTTVWEEHLAYFTSETFRRTFRANGLSLVHFESFPYPLENSLVGIAQARDSGTFDSREGKTALLPAAKVLDDETHRGLTFRDELRERRQLLDQFFTGYRREHGKIALLGAGHLACTYINLLELKDRFEFVVDDNPNKRGLFMPGSRLPIRGSAALLEEDIKLCLLCVSPESEDRVVRNNEEFLRGGGEFYSVFPASKRALPI